MNFTLVGGRAFLLTVSFGLITCLMRWFDKLDNTSWTVMMGASVCAYIAKSAMDEHTKIRSELQRDIAATQATSDPPAVVDQVAK